MRCMPRLLSLCAAILAVMPIAGHAQSSDPVTVIVPYAPGGASDQITRLVTQAAAKPLGRSIIVENKPGAGGILAAQLLEKAKPDGNTLMVGSNAPLVVNLGLYKQLPYSPEKFVPVVGLAKTPLVLLTPPDVEGTSVKDFIDYAKRQDKPLSMGSASNGNITHLAGVNAAHILGIEVMHVPFQGSAPAIVALVGKSLEVMFDALPSSMPQVKAGRLKAWAVLDDQRFPGMPDVPTMKEAGFENTEASAWFGLVAPEGTPAEAVEAMNKAVNVALADPKVQEGLRGIGTQPMPGDPSVFAAFIEAEKKQWLPVVKETGIQAD